MKQDSYGIWVGMSGWVFVGRLAKITETPTGLEWTIDQAAVCRRYGDSSVYPGDGGGLGCAQRGEMDKVQLEPLVEIIMHEANTPFMLPVSDLVRDAYLRRLGHV